MRLSFLIISSTCFVLVALATPLAIGLGLYDWVVNDNEFKFALWGGFKAWVTLLLLSIPGFIFYLLGKE